MRSTVGLTTRGNRTHPSICVSTRSLWLCYFRNLVLFQQQQQQQQGGGLCRSYSSCILRSSSWSKKDRQATRQWLLTDFDQHHASYLIQPSRARSTLSTATVTSTSSLSSPKEFSPRQQTNAHIQHRLEPIASSSTIDRQPHSSKTMPHPRWFNTTNDIDQQLEQLKAHRMELDDAFIFKTLRSMLYNVSQYKSESAWLIYETMLECQVVDHMRANHYGHLLNIIKYAPKPTPQLLAIMENMKKAEERGLLVIEGRHYSQIMFGMSRQADVLGICNLLGTLAHSSNHNDLLQPSWYTSLALAAKRQGHQASSLAAAKLMEQAMQRGIVLEQRACAVMIAALSTDMKAVTRFLTAMKDSGMIIMEDNDNINEISLGTTDLTTKKFNIHIYTSLISGLARKGDEVNAQRVWKMMRKAGLQPTTATYTAMVEAYGRSGNIKAAMNLMKKYTYENKGQLNKVMATSVLVNSIRSKNLKQAQELLSTWVSKMGLTVDKRMDPEFWSAVMWVKVLEDVELARGFYGSLYDQNKEYVDAVMVNHLVNGFGDAGKKEQVLDSFALHEDLPSKSSMPPASRIDPHFFLMDSLFKCRDVPAALSALVVMRRHSIPDDITMAMVIRGLVMNNENDLAWKLFLKLQSSGLEPNIHAYTSILQSCIHGGKRGGKKAMESLQQVQRQIPIDLLESSLGITDPSSVASGLVGDKKLGPDQAYILFRKMTGYHKPNVYTYTTLIACFAKHNIGRAVSIFTHMCADGVEPTMETYVALLQGCAIFRYAPVAIMVFQHMQERHFIPNDKVWHYLLKALVRARVDKKEIDQLGDMVRGQKQKGSDSSL